MSGLRGGGYMVHYASAKHAVVGLTNSLANELAPQWIRVNSIHPGNVLTPMIEARAVSNAVLFLASNEAQYITGAALPVDAGAVAKF